MRYICRSFIATIVFCLMSLAILSFGWTDSSVSAGGSVISSTDFNVPSDSFIVEDGGYQYFIDDPHYAGGTLYRMKKGDLKSKKRLVDFPVSHLTKQGEWLYFSALDVENKGLYKIKIDGTQKKRLSTRYIDSITSVGDWVYYISKHEAFRVTTSGAKEERLFPGVKADSLFVANGWIYYSAITKAVKGYGRGIVYKSEIGSAQSQKVADTVVTRMAVQGEWIYYQDEKQLGIYRMRTDGTDATKLASGEEMVLTGNAIYYIGHGENEWDIFLHRMNLDGSQATALAPFVPKAFNIVGDRIYYFSYSSSRTLFELSATKVDWSKLDGKPYYADTASLIVKARKEKIPYALNPKGEADKKLYKSIDLAFAAVDKITLPNMTDDEKLKAVHDYIAKTTVYDYENYLNHTIPDDSYSEYGVLNNGVAVCNGYALAMKLMLDIAGVESYYVKGTVSKENKETGQKTDEGHAWNVVKIGDRYYQVDATWDDSISDDPEYISYAFYKVTDEFMKKSRKWDASQAPAAM